jgi:hypothetical protein
VARRADRLPAAVNNTTAFYAAPQEPADARRLWDAACASAGFTDVLALPIPAGRAYGSSLLLAREWGEFTWDLGLDEPHPRGQFNAFLAAAEACGPGMWERLSSDLASYRRRRGHGTTVRTRCVHADLTLIPTVDR